MARETAHVAPERIKQPIKITDDELFEKEGMNVAVETSDVTERKSFMPIVWLLAGTLAMSAALASIAAATLEGIVPCGSSRTWPSQARRSRWP